MWFTKKREPRKNLILDTTKKLNKLRRGKIKQTSLEELNKIIRTFLEEKYKIKRSLTLEEAMKVLMKKRIDKQTKLDIAPILMEIYEKEYKTKEPLTKKQLVVLIDKIKVILKEISA